MAASRASGLWIRKATSFLTFQSFNKVVILDPKGSLLGDFPDGLSRPEKASVTTMVDGRYLVVSPVPALSTSFGSALLTVKGLGLGRDWGVGRKRVGRRPAGPPRRCGGQGHFLREQGLTAFHNVSVVPNPHQVQG